MSMKEHYKRLLGEMVQTKERGEEALLSEGGNAQRFSRIEDAIFRKDNPYPGMRRRGTSRLKRASERAREAGWRSIRSRTGPEFRVDGGVTHKEIIDAASHLTPVEGLSQSDAQAARDKAKEIMAIKLRHAGKAYSPLRGQEAAGPTIRQARIEAQRRAHQLGEMAQTAARGNETAVAAERLKGFSTHPALPAEVQAEYAAKLARLQRVIGQEQSSPKTYDLGGRIVGPGGRLGRRRAKDPAQSGPISIASDSGRRAAAARMPFGMR
jgi:hypothetical protein